MSDEIDDDKPLTRAEIDKIFDEKLRKMAEAMSVGMIASTGFLYEMIIYFASTGLIDMVDIEDYWKRMSTARLNAMRNKTGEIDYDMEAQLRMYLMGLLESAAGHFEAAKSFNDSPEKGDEHA